MKNIKVAISVFFAFFTLSFLIFQSMWFFVISPEFLLKAKVKTMPDTALFYEYPEYYQLFSQYSHDGYVYYQKTVAVLDMFFPIVYGLFFASGFLFFYQYRSKKVKISLLAFALVTVFFDCVENFLIHRSMNIFPGRFYCEAVALSFTTSMKFLFFLISLTLLVCGIGFYSYDRNKSIKHKN